MERVTCDHDDLIWVGYLCFFFFFFFLYTYVGGFGSYDIPGHVGMLTMFFISFHFFKLCLTVRYYMYG